MLKEEQRKILDKFNISELNEMQLKAYETINNNKHIVLLSPTGSGKTLAFLLPILSFLKKDIAGIQTLILVPSRELALQIEQVARQMGSGYKINSVFGGQTYKKDKLILNHPPAILIGTPGRIADHLKRKSFSTETIKTLILDEFDKSLEVGFEKDMKDIIEALYNTDRKILTSATQGIDIPEFVKLNNVNALNFLEDTKPALTVKKVDCHTNSKLEELCQLLSFCANERTVVFCNFKDTIQRISDKLKENKIQHACFYGGMEQKDRELSLVKFRNSSANILLATDLAARGIDVPEIKSIIHYHIPQKEEEYTHRNGRTARMNASGIVYVLKNTREEVPGFINFDGTFQLSTAIVPVKSMWKTLLIGGGRKDKISKGDIAGLFFKQGGLNSNELGAIELKIDIAYAAVPLKKARELAKSLNNSKLKKKKVRIRMV